MSVASAHTLTLVFSSLVLESVLKQESERWESHVQLSREIQSQPACALMSTRWTTGPSLEWLHWGPDGRGSPGVCQPLVWHPHSDSGVQRAPWAQGWPQSRWRNAGRAVDRGLSRLEGGRWRLDSMRRGGPGHVGCPCLEAPGAGRCLSMSLLMCLPVIR